MMQANKSRRRALIAAALLPMSLPCLATVTFDPSVDAGYQYISNVFDLESGFPIPGTNDFQKSDSLYTYGAGLVVNDTFAQQKLYLKLSDTEYKYDHFSELNHNEYAIDGGLDWKLGHLFDGEVDVQRNHQMVAFTNTNNADFELLTEQRESGLLGFNFTPDWRLEGSGYYRTMDQSFAQEPALTLTETQEQVALKYVALAGLTSGVSAAYYNGDYSGPGALTNPNYHQTTAQLVATYVPTGRSTFNGALGYSDRSSGTSINTITGVTGTFDYKNQLTGKTSVDLQLSRLINNYIADLGSEIDTIAALNVNWQATYKIGVVLNYSYTYRQLPGQGDAPLGSDRLDHLQLVSLNVDYEPLDWLSLKPFVTYQLRGSNYVGANFNATVVGVNFTIHPYSRRDQPAVRVRN
jgi:hypothetical protein